MTTTEINHDNDLNYWANQLRAALAAAPEGSTAAARAREMANRAYKNHTLSINMLKLLVNTLEKAHPAPVPEPVAEVQPEPAPKALPANKFAKPCERCGKWVEAGEGVRERDDDDTRWMVSHKEGECPVDMLDGVPEGRYALDPEGDDNVKFYQIREGVLYTQASAELWPVKGVQAIKDILDAIKVDPRAASLLYGIKLEHCGVCGRKLTNKASRDLGIGPICADKMGW